MKRVQIAKSDRRVHVLLKVRGRIMQASASSEPAPRFQGRAPASIGKAAHRYLFRLLIARRLAGQITFS